MLPMIQHYLAKANGSLTWNNQWISDFESPWSVFEKIKYLNNANKKDIFELFGTSKINAQKTIIGEANHNLYHLVSMDEKRLFDTLGFNVKQYNNDILYNLAGFLKGGKRYTFSLKELWPNYFRNLFTYCSECLKDGYHSLLHQFEFIHTCPFHQVALNDECPDCNQQFPYILSDTHFESPYTCKCGYCFKKVATKYPLSMQWGKYTTSDLTDNNLIDWLLLNEEEQSQLSYFFIYPFTDKKMYPHLMPLLLNNVKEDSSFESDDIEFRYINSSTNILNLENQNTIHEKHKTSWEPMTHTLTGVSAFDSSRKQIIKELVHTKHDIINAVGRYLKKSILRDHSSCIMRYVSVSKFVDSDLTPICPYAYA
ncbi:TniQ family protein, partial [Cohnella sp. JJ-181]|uniref:TniQ family protein n=1 Tax=Cohnella rhizoplanae TaxID=2974897 RepID=UPI00232F33FF